MTTTRTKRPPRDRGQGSIFKEESRNRWVALLSREGLPRKKFTAKTKAEVLEKLEQAKRDLKAGKSLPKARDTVGALLTDWQERGYPYVRYPGAPVSARAKKNKTGNTQAGYAWAVAHLTDPETGIAGFKLGELKASVVETFLDEKVNPTGGTRPLAHRSAVQLLRVLRTALQWGIREERVGKNVALEVSAPEEGSRRPSQAFKPEEVTALLSAAADADQEAMRHSGSSGRATPLEAAWYVMALMGLRPGECFALRWSDVDFDTGMLTVAGSLVRDQKTNTLRIGPTKTVKSQSRLDIPAPVLDVLRDHRKWQMANELATELVFSNDSGGLLDPAATRRRFKKLCARAGVSDAEKCHPHELRHSCGSILEYLYGKTAAQAADQLRHTDVHTYLRIYRHSDVMPSVPHALSMAALAPRRPTDA